MRVLGMDGAGVRDWGDLQGVVVAVDLGDGQPVALGLLDERNPLVVRKWLEPLIQQVGVTTLVTDDLFSYRVVVEKLGFEHQVCQFHVRRWVGKALRDLTEKFSPDWLWVLEEIKVLLAELSPEGSRRLLDLCRQIPERHSMEEIAWSALLLLKQLLLRSSEHWASYRLFNWQKEGPWTNNQTEQGMGRMKMRSRTVRGDKNESRDAQWAPGCGYLFEMIFLYSV